MKCPYCELSALSMDGLERIAICKDCRGDWMSNRTPRAVQDGNVIYLRFANTNENEDQTTIRRAA